MTGGDDSSKRHYRGTERIFLLQRRFRKDTIEIGLNHVQHMNGSVCDSLKSVDSEAQRKEGWGDDLFASFPLETPTNSGVVNPQHSHHHLLLNAVKAVSREA